MEIKRIGNYFETDAQGYLMNRANLQGNQPQWLEVVDAVKNLYLESWGEVIHSIYVRGSLAKGLAIDAVSDVDSFAVVKPKTFESLPERREIRAWRLNSGNALQAKFPFITGLEAGLNSHEDVTSTDLDNVYGFIIKVEGTCIHGEDLAEHIAPYKPHHRMAFQTRYIHRHINVFFDEFPDTDNDDKRDLMIWMMRRFVRLGMEFVMTEEQRFTRDLYLCYESFSKHYPEMEKDMYQALELAINPRTDDKSVAFVKTFGDWLISEAHNKLTAWGYQLNDEGRWTL